MNRFLDIWTSKLLLVKLFFSLSKVFRFSERNKNHQVFNCTLTVEKLMVCMQTTSHANEHEFLGPFFFIRNTLNTISCNKAARFFSLAPNFIIVAYCIISINHQKVWHITCYPLLPFDNSSRLWNEWTVYMNRDTRHHHVPFMCQYVTRAEKKEAFQKIDTLQP